MAKLCVYILQRADLAIASLTMTSQREEVISFTMPYMNLGISILIKKAPPRPPEPFSFLKPLSHEIWLYTITAYAAVTCLLFMLARFSPYEWIRPKRCILTPADRNVVENQFSFINTLWFTMGSLMTQGKLSNTIRIRARVRMDTNVTRSLS